MILITVITCVAFGAVNLSQEGNRLHTVDTINPVTWSTAIGFAVYAYEGIGMILPVQDITANPKQYPKVMIAVIVFTCFLYTFFGNYACIAWGDELKTPLITDQLNRNGAPLWIGWVVKVLFCFNLLFSFPLVIYPTVMINENYLFDGWAKSKKRQWFKNLNRSLVVAFVVGLTIALHQKLDKFLSILGALACTPVAFLFPSLFHFQACAETTFQKTVDLLLLVMSIAIMIYCTTDGILTWND